jgi:hypothetical protein
MEPTLDFSLHASFLAYRPEARWLISASRNATQVVSATICDAGGLRLGMRRGLRRDGEEGKGGEA